MSAPELGVTYDGPVWNLDDPGNAQPNVWPACSTCGVAYVYRQCFTFGPGSIAAEWLWQRDCKHKAPHVIKTVEG